MEWTRNPGSDLRHAGGSCVQTCSADYHAAPSPGPIPPAEPMDFPRKVSNPLHHRSTHCFSFGQRRLFPTEFQKARHLPSQCTKDFDAQFAVPLQFLRHGPARFPLHRHHPASRGPRYPPSRRLSRRPPPDHLQRSRQSGYQSPPSASSCSLPTKISAAWPASPAKPSDASSPASAAMATSSRSTIA